MIDSQDYQDFLTGKLFNYESSKNLEYKRLCQFSNNYSLKNIDTIIKEYTIIFIYPNIYALCERGNENSNNIKKSWLLPKW